MIWRLAALGTLAATLAVACTRSGPPPVTAGPPEKNAPTDRATLKLDLEMTIRESYAALSGGYDEAYLDGLERGNRLLLIDVGPEDVVVGFQSKACTMRQQFDNHHAQIVIKRLEVQVAQDGTSGWSFADLSYRVLHEGRRVIIPMRSTAMYERRAGDWVLVQEHVSYAIPDDEAWAEAVAGTVPAPTPMEDFVAPGTEAPEVRALLEKLIFDTDDTRAALLDDGADALMLGSDPDRELRGPDAAAVGTVRALYGYDNSVALKNLRVRVSATGKSAWAAANVVVIGPHDDVADARLPLRVTWVLERRAGAWKVVQTHVSVPVSTEQLSMRVFGEATI